MFPREPQVLLLCPFRAALWMPFFLTLSDVGLELLMGWLMQKDTSQHAIPFEKSCYELSVEHRSISVMGNTALNLVLK